MMSVLSLQSVRFSAEPKGIGSILSKDVEAKQRRSSQSLRRTLSADMSSKGWIARENPLRKTCSSYKLFGNSDSDSAEYSDSDAEDRNPGEEEEEHDVFSMMDAEYEDEEEEAAEEDEQDPENLHLLHLWSLRRFRTKPQHCEASFASLFVKEVKSDSSQWEPCKPYVHPKKKNMLSDQSLRMCTEALGCESGTGCSYGSLSDLDDNCSSSEDSVSEEEEKEEEENRQIPSEDDGTAENYKFSDNVSGSVQGKEIICGTKSLRSAKSFPPPLSSISRSNGPCISMRSHKQDGRLLLQAVKVESHKYLHAHRVDGRLQLRFIGTPLPLSAEQSSQGEKISQSQPAKEEEEFRAQNSAPEQKSQQQLESYMFSKVSNLRRHTLKSEFQNLNLNKELFLNSNLTSSVKKASLFNEHQEKTRGSSNIVSKDSNDFHLKFRRAELNSRLCNTNDFCKPPVSANTSTGWKDSPKSRPSQRLITSPTLLNYPLNGIRYFGGDLKESVLSLSKSPLKEVFRRCKDRKWSLNCEPYCIATS